MPLFNRRHMLKGLGLSTLAAIGNRGLQAAPPAARQKAQIAITLDLEMSRHYPTRQMTEWDYQKGNLDGPTKDYSLKAAQLTAERGALIHFFCVGRVLEQPDISWLQQIAKLGHPVGNHTYDHVNVHARTLEAVQFRFKRSPWLANGRTPMQVIRDNIRITNIGLKERAGIVANGFRTPGGFHDGLKDRPDIQDMLLDQGFTWVSSLYPRHKSGETMKPPTADVYEDIVATQSKAQPFLYPSGLLEIPMSPISDITGFRTRFWKLDYFLKAIRLAVEWTIENRAVFDFLCHPSCLVVEDPEFKTINMICDIVKEAGDRAEIVGLDTIARPYLK